MEARQCLLLLLVDVQLRKWLMCCSLVVDMVRDPIRLMVGWCWKRWRGWVGGRVEQGSDVDWQLVIWSLSMKFDSSGCIVVGFGYCEDDEVGYKPVVVIRLNQEDRSKPYC